AWIELVSDDPEAVSAFAVARAHLPAGRALRSLRRLRLFELSGPLPARAGLEDLLHRSIQFYNPHKERCAVRAAASDTVPLADGEHAVLVFERGEERRGGAERWWRHETGRDIEVREGVAWILGFEPMEADPRGAVAELTVLRGRRQGLLCNLHAQEYRLATGAVPVPWMSVRT
ncbi:MAG: hypothetical protein ACRENJ_07335, partial [Candidatus Eiseniibacteriota bacterium]